MIHVLLMFIWAAFACVQGDYVLEVLVFEYQNPTSGCASCGSPNLGCCGLVNTTCVTEDDHCDNYFIFCIRPFGTEPNNNAAFFETGCTLKQLSYAASNDDQLTFTTGETALIGLPNPLPFAIAGSWLGATQLFIDVRSFDIVTFDLDTVDRFYIDRDDIELGANFSAATFYNGSFGWGCISLTMRVNCAEGFSGDTCNLDLDPCARTTPCQNGGTCTTTTGPDQFECQCAEGYGGVTCSDRETDECDSDPCLNGATCMDGVGTFTCVCQPGYTGQLCEQETPDNGSGAHCQASLSAVIGAMVAGALVAVIATSLVAVMVAVLVVKRSQKRVIVTGTSAIGGGDIMMNPNPVYNQVSLQKTPDEAEHYMNEGMGPYKVKDNVLYESVEDAGKTTVPTDSNPAYDITLSENSAYGSL